MRKKVEFEKQRANSGPAIGFRHGHAVWPGRIGQAQLGPSDAGRDALRNRARVRAE